MFPRPNQGSMPSNIRRHDFSTVPHADIKRSVFNRSHGHKTTFDVGYLVPCYVDEVLPGDTVTLKMSSFGRILSPLMHPIMENIHFDTFFFFVPNRIIWDNWEKFMGARDNPTDDIDYLIPQITVDTTYSPTGKMSLAQRLYDYMGVPMAATNSSRNTKVNNLHGRAYVKIYNEWFRDQNLQAKVEEDRDDGPDGSTSVTQYNLLKRNKRHDYFTSCLPWPQKGDAVSLPLAGEFPVRGIGKLNQTFDQTNELVYESDRYNNATRRLYPESAIVGLQGTLQSMNDDEAFYIKGKSDGSLKRPDIMVQLAENTAVTINEMRESFQIQRLLERDARGGTRYVEILQSHFGVTSPDFRLQRPEYLGGGRSHFVTQAIPQTSQTTNSGAIGDLGAYGLMQAHNHGFHKSFVEHGVLLGIMCVFFDQTYQQGLHRMWSRRDRYDFYMPALAHLGEQAVLTQELRLNYNDADNNKVFGYQERWAEYRYSPSRISGQLRSDAPGNLDTWHGALDFNTRPNLNAGFVREAPPIDRFKAETGSSDDIIMDMWFDIKHARPMPVHSVPGMIDHF